MTEVSVIPFAAHAFESACADSRLGIERGQRSFYPAAWNARVAGNRSCAGLRGGGCSHFRTCLPGKFPSKREKPGIWRENSRVGVNRPLYLAGISVTWSKFPSNSRRENLDRNREFERAETGTGSDPTGIQGLSVG